MQNEIVSFFERARQLNTTFILNLQKKLRNINKSRVLNIILWIVIIASSFSTLYIGCRSVEYFSDDIAYLYKLEMGKPLTYHNELISSVKDVFISQYNHWFSVNGRTVSHVALQLVMFLFSKPVVDAISSAITVLLSLLIARYRSYGYADGKITKTDFLLSFSLLVLLTPERMWTFSWTTGVFNYPLPSILVLLFFMQYMCLPDNTAPKRSAAAEAALGFASLIGGIIAGWTTENIAPTMVCAMIFIVAYRKAVYGKGSPFSSYAGIIGAFAGCCMTLLSPGSRTRMSTLDGKQDMYSNAMHVAFRGYYMERALFDFMLPAIATISVLIIITRLLGAERLNIQSTGLLIWSALSYITMVLSPTYPARATYGTIVLMLIPMISLLAYLRNNYKMGKYIVPLSWFLFAAANAQLLTEAIRRMYGID